jgi:hypothetical protein
MKTLSIQINITQAYSSGEGIPGHSTDTHTASIRAACSPLGCISLLPISQEKQRLLF